MVLSLITPAGPNFMKDFPAQNTVNLDRIDEYAGPSLTSHPLQPWTPALTAVTTDPVLGTGGFIRGWYYEIFDQIYAWGEFRFGTAAIGAGSGNYIMSLPFPAKTLMGASVNLGATPIVGTGYIWDASGTATRLPLTAHLRTSTSVFFTSKFGLGAREVRDTGPNVWAINDGITFCARYQRDA